MHFFQYAYHYIVWLATIPAFIYQYIYSNKKQKRQNVVTYTDRIIGFVWITFAIVIILLGFLIGLLTTGEYYTHIIHILLAVYGMPVFLTGVIVRFKPLTIGGIACWILCIIFMLYYDLRLPVFTDTCCHAWLHGLFPVICYVQNINNNKYFFMEEKELSNEESLKLINRMIYEAKGYFYESGIKRIDIWL